MSYQQPPPNEPWQQLFYPPQPPSAPPPPPKKRRRRRWPWIVAILIASIVACGIIGNALPKTPDTSATNSPQTSAATSTLAATVAPKRGPTATPQPKPTASIDQQINTIVQNAGLSGKEISNKYNVGGDNAEVIDENIGDGNLTFDQALFRL